MQSDRAYVAGRAAIGYIETVTRINYSVTWTVSL
jgi:hypothetical protein